MTEPKKLTTRAYRLTAELHEHAETDRSTGPASAKQRKAELSKLYRTFAERMYHARVDINSWSQQHAAKLLGYKNSSPLAKIEQGGKFPPWMPVAAARTYKVTADYLLGLCDHEYELRAPGTEWEQAIVDANKANLQILISEHSKYLARIARTTQLTVEGLGQVIQSAAEVKELFDRLRELNPTLWEEARGGSRLENAVIRMHASCQTVRRDAERARIALKVQACEAGVEQMVNGRLELLTGE